MELGNGTWRGPCNRSACQKPGATFFNQSTRAYYCAACAEMINKANAVDAKKLFGDPRLCIEVSSRTAPKWDAKEGWVRDDTPGVIRYVATHVGKDGMRTLASAAQGRYTYDTPYPAKQWIADVLANNSLDSLKSVYGFPLEVRPVECWPVHFDPKTVWFD